MLRTIYFSLTWARLYIFIKICKGVVRETVAIREFRLETSCTDSYMHAGRNNVGGNWGRWQNLPNVWFGLKRFIFIVVLSTMATVGLVGLQPKKYQFSRRCQRIYAVCSCVYLRKCTGPSCLYSSFSLRSVWSELVVFVSSVSGQWSAS